MFMRIVYALVDPQTHHVRYVGKSAHGLLRPLSHRSASHNYGLAAWLRDLKARGQEYVTVILAQATTDEQLAVFEAYWIDMGVRFGWPLENKHHPTASTLGGKPPKKWTVENWRRDPEVQEKLAGARRRNLPR